MDLESKNIWVVGDIHAEWPKFNKWLSRKNYPDIVLQVGDFGWWPHYHNRQGLSGKKFFDQYGIRNKTTKIFWCDGNHENHDDLQALVKKHGITPIEVMPNVFYCPRGSTISINGKNILFFGGASSIDKEMRIPGDSWWPGENISQRDMASLPDMEIHTVVSHTCPSKFTKFFNKRNFQHDSNALALNQIFDLYKPHRWYFGHYHLFDLSSCGQCNFTCLSNIEGEEIFSRQITF
ncbi:MAG: metallophosphoesterase [Epsilonproteobacteria bacterium]|nr:metallophosphoesterase [Campylobacterota bacterium]